MKVLHYNLLVAALCLLIASSTLSFRTSSTDAYTRLYHSRIDALRKELMQAEGSITNLTGEAAKNKALEQIISCRAKLKAADFWLRYLEPINYKLINGPLPVEWETEVFEKYEKPYRRIGAGLTLAELYLDEEEWNADSLRAHFGVAQNACESYKADSVTERFSAQGSFFLCNRLWLLNLATIYTSGFECPAPNRIVPELRQMLNDTRQIYQAYNESHPGAMLPDDYLMLYHAFQEYLNTQPEALEDFDHFTMIRDYVNPLFSINQTCIRNLKVSSKSFQDYTLTKTATSIFSKDLFDAQSIKGLFQRVYDQKVLAQIREFGKNLFFDPLLSGNNERSCASCHKPGQAFTDTAVATAFAFDHKNNLPRNTPTLLNAQYNHLIMADGRHLNLQEQAKAVMSNTLEMSCAESDLLKKVQSCKDYKKTLKALLPYTPQAPTASAAHISSALTLYYGGLSKSYSPFDEAMNGRAVLSGEAKKGYNLFMGKAQCGTCHFAPHFNGVKPPYLGSEFEVIGVPADTSFRRLSPDKGRYEMNPAKETEHAFRTPGLKNIALTAPYMHNGVYKTLEQVVDFYDAGGAVGRGLQIHNQTLSGDSLHLDKAEKKHLIVFLKSLTENFPSEKSPEVLPRSSVRAYNSRKPGGSY